MYWMAGVLALALAWWFFRRPPVKAAPARPIAAQRSSAPAPRAAASAPAPAARETALPAPGERVFLVQATDVADLKTFRLPGGIQPHDQFHAGTLKPPPASVDTRLLPRALVFLQHAASVRVPRLTASRR